MLSIGSEPTGKKWMICSLTGEVASEKVSKARKLFDKLTFGVECNGKSLFDC